MARSLQLDDPPRTVPASAQVAVVFAGVTQQIGWIFLLFGLLFGWLFGLDSEAITAVQFQGEQELTSGAVIDVTQTAASENDRPIYGIRYTYTVDGVAHVGVSYSTNGNYADGQVVTVQYLVEEPKRSRIEGLRVRKFGAFAIFPIIFPLVGLAMALRGVYGGLRARRLLRSGKLAFGTLVNKEATNTRINKQTVYKLTFEFTVQPEQKLFGYRQSAMGEAKTYQAVHKTHRTHALEDEPEEPLLYDPADPRRVYPIDALPGGVTVSAAGHVVGPASLVKALGLPLLGLTALAAFLVALCSTC